MTESEKGERIEERRVTTEEGRARERESEGGREEGKMRVRKQISGVGKKRKEG